MSDLGLIVMLLAMLGVFFAIAALSQLWNYGTNGSDTPVGEWRSARPPAPVDPTLPRDYRTLMWGETHGWSQPAQWQFFVERLDEIERGLGGDPGARNAPAPPEYSRAWLDARLQGLEALSGPLPSPMDERIVTEPKRSRWKRK